MTGLQNLHSHTKYCDGILTLEEMVYAAIGKGCDSFGFSGHGYAPFDPGTMSLENTERYLDEIRQLKEKYADRIELFTGIEQEYHGDLVQADIDYMIGAVHFVKYEGLFMCVDGNERVLRAAVDTYLGGDYYKLAELYYELAADIARKTNADIIAHFDIVKKYNIAGSMFDETNPRYVGAALDAMNELLKSCRIFEVNTGAMYRFNKPEPYPSEFLLKELYKRGGEVIITSDSHDGESIGYKFGEMRELLKSCGFKYSKRLTKNGFIDVLL